MVTVLLATGATRPRDLDVPGRNLGGIHFAFFGGTAMRILYFLCGAAGRMASLAMGSRTATQSARRHGRVGAQAVVERPDARDGAVEGVVALQVEPARDAHACRIAEGTSQIQRLLLAREIAARSR